MTALLTPRGGRGAVGWATAAKRLAVIVVACGGFWPTSASAQQEPQSAPESTLSVLTLEEAVALATRNNRTVTDAVLEAEKFGYRLNVARSRRRPQLQVAVLAGQSLHAVTSTFPAGAFGTYPATGPIPTTEAKVRTPAQFTTVVTGSLDQPILQQHKIGLGIKATEVAGDIAREAVRAQRQKVAAEVRAAYFRLVAAQGALDAARESVRTLEEAQRVTAEYSRQQVVLRAEALEVDARLARGRYDLAVAENRLATGRERLNQLLARDLTTPFRVAAMPEDEAIGLTLGEARRRAADARPEIRQAELKKTQAEYERRLARADYIPDLSASLRYVGFNNFDVIPGQVTTAGLYLTWEPFDWGRRRSQVAEKVTVVEQTRTAADELRAQVDLEVGAKYRAWQEAAQLLKAARTGHHAALEQLRVTTSRYREQAALTRDLLQAQTRGTEAQFHYQDALAAYWTALADLRRAVGDE